MKFCCFQTVLIIAICLCFVYCVYASTQNDRKTEKYRLRSKSLVSFPTSLSTPSLSANQNDPSSNIAHQRVKSQPTPQEHIAIQQLGACYNETGILYEV